MRPETDFRQLASDTIPAGVLRDFIHQALRHDAIRDVLIERMVSRATKGRLDAPGLSPTLPALIAEILDAATAEDWLEIADALIEDTREALQEEAES